MNGRTSAEAGVSAAVFQASLAARIASAPQSQDLRPPVRIDSIPRGPREKSGTSGSRMR